MELKILNINTSISSMIRYIFQGAPMLCKPFIDETHSRPIMQKRDLLVLIFKKTIEKISPTFVLNELINENRHLTHKVGVLTVEIWNDKNLKKMLSPSLQK